MGVPFFGGVASDSRPSKISVVPVGMVGFLSCEDPYMGGCQNYGSFLGTLNIRCRIISGIQKGTILLTTTHMIPSTTLGP